MDVDRLPGEADFGFVRGCWVEKVFDEAVDVGGGLEGCGLFLVLGRQLSRGLASQKLSQSSDVALNTQRELLESCLWPK